MPASPPLAANHFPIARRDRCDYCALPLNCDSLADSPDEPRYCCFGCRFAAAVAAERGNASEAGGAQLRLGLAVFFSMNVMVFTMFLWSQPEGEVDRAPQVMYDVARYLCLLFSLPVFFLLGPTLVADAAHGLARRRVETSLLLLTGVLASFGYSAWSVFVSQGHIYFEVGVVVLVAATLGRWLEAQGKLRTTQALRELQTLLPDQVRQLAESSERMVPLSSLACGDVVRILPGERIAVDGCVLRGRAAVDEQMVTGESLPIEKQPKDEVFSGSLNLDGELIVQLTAPPSAGTLQRLIDSVLSAVTEQVSCQRLADRIAAWFLPAIAALAALTFAGHLALRASISSSSAIEQALLAALAVVVISCPCALGLATPLALWAAIGNAARRQVLFRNGDALARLARAKVICFDKTGTLTTGEMEVACCWRTDDLGEDMLFDIVRPLTRSTNHPASRAVQLYVGTASDHGSDDLKNIRELPGRGIVAWSEQLQGEVRLGSLNWMRCENVDCQQWDVATSDDNVWSDCGLVLVAWNGQVQAAFALREELRADAAATIRSLRERDLQVVLLTGDRAARANKLGQVLGVDVIAELLPHQKLAQIATLHEQVGPVVMVGDGLNDAPALAAADIGIALGCGADLSRDAAGVCLLGNQLVRLVETVDLARDADRVIRWNLFWAFGYNIAGIPLAMLGLVNPVFAAIFMAVSSLLVTTNSLRLARSEDDSRASATGDFIETGECPVTSDPSRFPLDAVA